MVLLREMIFRLRAGRGRTELADEHREAYEHRQDEEGTPPKGTPQKPRAPKRKANCVPAKDQDWRKEPQWQAPRRTKPRRDNNPHSKLGSLGAKSGYPQKRGWWKFSKRVKLG